jgi:hypothetical protein
MRILLAFTCHRYRGGAEAFTLRLARVLAARGNKVQLVAVEQVDQGPRGAATWVDETVEGVDIRRVSFDLAAAPDADRWEYDNPWVGAVLEDLIRRGHPDLFHLVSGYLMTGRALRVAREQGVPSVVSLTDYWFLCRRLTMLRSDGTLSTVPINPATCARCLGEEQRRFRIPGRLAPGLMGAFWRSQHRRLERLQARTEFLTETLLGADALISPSEFLRRCTARPAFRSTTSPSSRMGTSCRARIRPDRRSRTPRLRAGYLGQIAGTRGFTSWSKRSAAQGAPVSLSIHGDLAHFPDFSATAKALPRRPASLSPSLSGGQAERRQPPDLDVVVIPSVWYENCPNVILEAFAHRTPVIATDLGGMAEMVSHGRNGLLFRVGDAADLADQFRRLLSEPGLLPALRDGVPAVKTFADEVSEIEAVYRRVVDVRGREPVPR